MHRVRLDDIIAEWTLNRCCGAEIYLLTLIKHNFIYHNGCH